MQVAGDADDSDMRPRTALALRENEELLLNFKRIATLEPIDGIARPADRATDFAGGARMAEELGMKQLAARLERMRYGVSQREGDRSPPDHPLAA